jgi:hypothetical protein
MNLSRTSVCLFITAGAASKLPANCADTSLFIRIMENDYRSAYDEADCWKFSRTHRVERDYTDFTLKLTYDKNASKQPPTGPFVPSKENILETATYTADCPEAIVFYRICEHDLLNEVNFSWKVLQEYGEKYRNQCPYSVEILPTGRKQGEFIVVEGSISITVP